MKCQWQIPSQFMRVTKTNQNGKGRSPRYVSISELRKAPRKVIESAGDGPVALLNHNAPVAYILSPKMMGNLLDLVADKLLEQCAQGRLPALNKAKVISLPDL